MSTKAKRALLWLGAMAIAFGAGVTAPKVKAALFPKQAHPTFFADTKSRVETPCPAPGPRIMVAVILGQSLAGNWAGERAVGRDGVLNAFNGRCYRAQDPLLGATGIAGNHWTQVANELVAHGVYDQVVLLQVTRGWTAIAHFAPPNEGLTGVRDELAALKGGLTATHFMIQQGQTDHLNGTSYDAYRSTYATVLAELRKIQASAPIFVSVEAGYCGPLEAPAPDSHILKAQRSLVDPEHGIFKGPEVDDILDGSLRYDGCHPSGAGARILAQAWTKVIEAHVSR